MNHYHSSHMSIEQHFQKQKLVWFEPQDAGCSITQSRRALDVLMHCFKCYNLVIQHG